MMTSYNLIKKSELLGKPCILILENGEITTKPPKTKPKKPKKPKS